MPYVTAVFELQDSQDAADAWQDLIRPYWGPQADEDALPVRITAMSCDHEMERVQRIQEAVDRHTDPWALREEIQEILACPDLSCWSPRRGRQDDHGSSAVSRVLDVGGVKIDESRKIAELGPSIGTYRDRDIPDYLVMEDGTRFRYNRIAQMKPDGDVAMDQLRRGETIIAPGLVYRQVG